MKTLYTTQATASAGRNGQVESDDKKLTLSLSTPKEMGGTGEHTNPEQLFAAGYAACFASATAYVANAMKITLAQPPKTTATVGIGPNDNQGFSLTIALAVELDLPQDEAVKLVAKAHQVCPYSNAVRNNIDVKISVNNQAI
ncbi:organic hydroperoxide resistance protein [Shewanella gaetbuli]